LLEQERWAAGHTTKKTAATRRRLDIDIIRRRSPDGDWEQVSINVRATPSFAASARVFETANPLAFWAQAAPLMWMPWLLAAQTMMRSPNQAKSIAHADHGPQEA
jgi:hypothetical protein